MSQHEFPMFSPRQLAAALGVSEEGAQVSGGRLHEFREGWAHSIVTASGGLSTTMGRAHYYRRHELSAEVVALCGKTALVTFLFGAGSIKRCYNCRKKRGLVRVY